MARWAARFAERRARQVAGDEAAGGGSGAPAESAGAGGFGGSGNSGSRVAGSGGAGTGPDSGAGTGGSGSGGAGSAAAGSVGRVPPPPDYAPAVRAKPEPASVVPWGLRVAAETGWRLLVLAAVVWVLSQVITTIGLLITAFSAGLLITALLEPTAARLKRVGLGRGLATAATFVTGFVVMGLIGWFVVWQVTDNLPTLTNRVQDGIDELKNWALTGPFHVSHHQINNIAQTLSNWLGDNSKELTTAGLETVSVLVEFLSGALLTMFVTLFLLYDGRRIWEWVLKFVPSGAREGVAGAGPRAWTTLTGYVRGTVIVALIDAVAIGIGLYFLNVPMFVPLAVFIFLFAFIPIVGAVISGALAVVVALVTNDVLTAVLVLAVVLLVQQLESHVLQPFILGRLVRVHPLGVVLAVTGGTLVAGIAGAVVAVPLVAVLNTAIGYLRAYANEQAVRQGTRAAEAAEAAGGGAGGAAEGAGGAGASGGPYDRAGSGGSGRAAGPAGEPPEPTDSPDSPGSGGSSERPDSGGTPS